MRNPYHPIDPKWHIYEAELRRRKIKEDNKEIAKLMKSFRRKNMEIIMVVPSCSESETARARARKYYYTKVRGKTILVIADAGKEPRLYFHPDTPKRVVWMEPS